MTQILLEPPEVVFYPHPRQAGFARTPWKRSLAPRLLTCMQDMLTERTDWEGLLEVSGTDADAEGRLFPVLHHPAPPSKLRSGARNLRQIRPVHLSPAKSNTSSSNPCNWGCDSEGQRGGIVNKAHVWRFAPPPTMNICHLTVESTDEFCTDDRTNA